MYLSAARVAILPIVALLTLGLPGRSSGQASSDPHLPGLVRGTTVDASAGVLPGVVVAAASVDGRSLGSTVTNARGEFVLDGLPVGPVHLSFHLDGFEPSSASVTVGPQGGPRPAADAPFVHRMDLLGVTENVTVRGDPPPPPPPPRLVLAPVPDHDQVSVCGPAMAEGDVPSFGTIRSRRDDETKVLFAAGDELLIDGGSLHGLAVGHNFVVRRRYPTALRYGRNKSLIVMGEHSSGLLQIVDVEERVSTAVIVYACDEMMRGDYLTRFEPEPVHAPDPVGMPAFDRAARILFADAGQPLGVTGRMMVIDRGSRKDVRPGQRFTLFRRSRFGDARPLVIGGAVVVAVRTDSATIRVEHATDAIFFGERGDLAAPHQPPSLAGN
jgi:hypothetical protein